MSDFNSRLASHGFESNQDFSFLERTLLRRSTSSVLCLHITGTDERRLTAFAQAFAHAVAASKLVTHDFTDAESSMNPNQTALDRAVIEACAFSEAEPTLLLLDQLQAGAFDEQVRLHELVRHARWRHEHGEVRAHLPNLLVALVSPEPLYHPLQKRSFRLWIERKESGEMPFKPADFGLGEETNAVFDAMAALFSELDAAPTRSEFEKVLQDLQSHVHSIADLRHCLFGWVGAIERPTLFEADHQAALRQVLNEVHGWIGIDEVDLDDNSD